MLMWKKMPAVMKVLSAEVRMIISGKKKQIQVLKQLRKGVRYWGRFLYLTYYISIMLSSFREGGKTLIMNISSNIQSPYTYIPRPRNTNINICLMKSA